MCGAFDRFPPFSVTGTKCIFYKFVPTVLGQEVFRLRYWAGGLLKFISSGQTIRVYGPVSFTALCTHDGASCLNVPVVTV